jgi:phosphonate transport system permease protein
MIPKSVVDFVWIWHYLFGDPKQHLASAILTPLLETIQMAVVGTVLGAIPAFPLSFIAARTSSFFRPISVAFKTVLNIGRAVPVFVYAMIIVCWMGLGKETGAVAIGIGSFVMLCKLYAEALESVSPGPVEAVKAAGGNGAQVFVFGMLPQVFPNYLSSTLYAFELNLQASFILGMVGAGGIGFKLQTALNYYNLLEVGVLVFVLILLVNLVDYLSYRVRLVFS